MHDVTQPRLLLMTDLLLDSICHLIITSQSHSFRQQPIPLDTPICACHTINNVINAQMSRRWGKASLDFIIFPGCEKQFNFLSQIDEILKSISLICYTDNWRKCSISVPFISYRAGSVEHCEDDSGICTDVTYVGVNVS